MNREPEPDDAELEAIARAAAGLPLLRPSRDLWSGIEARIEARVVPLPVVRAAPEPVRVSWRRLAVAASLLVAATAGVTWSIVKHETAQQVATTGASPSVEPQSRASGIPVQAVALQTAEQTFDREIGAMRAIVDERRKDLDPATISVLEKNLKLIDAAIAESRAALAKDPASAFLIDRLTHAYDNKLQLLRGVASIPSHG
jgi:hypothetical protein